MDTNEFFKALFEIFGDDVKRATETTIYGIRENLRVYEIKSDVPIRAYLETIPVKPIAIIKVNDTAVVGVGIEEGKLAITVSNKFLEEASDVLIYQAISIIPLIASEILSKMREDDSDALVGITSLLNVENLNEVRDTTSALKRVAKKTVVKTKIAKDNYKKGFSDALRIYSRLLRDGWRLIDFRGGKALRYDKRINIDVIRSDGRYYPIPEDLLGKLYVEGVTVPLTERIEHIYVDKHVHPNIDNDGEMCLGEGKGVPLKDINLVVSLLRTANLDSPFGGHAQTVARMILEEIRSRGFEETVSLEL